MNVRPFLLKMLSAVTKDNLYKLTQTIKYQAKRTTIKLQSKIITFPFQIHVSAPSTVKVENINHRHCSVNSIYLKDILPHTYLLKTNKINIYKQSIHKYHLGNLLADFMRN